MRKLICLILCSFLIVTMIAGASLAEEITITNKPVNINLDLAYPALSPVLNVDQVNYLVLEYRNTDSNSGMTYPVPGDTSDIDGVMQLTALLDPNGVNLNNSGAGLNATWVMTATYATLVDDIYESDGSKFKFSTRQAVGVLTFYVNTIPGDIPANPSTGQGFDDGTMVAEFAVYNPDPLLKVNAGGVMNFGSLFDGSRDMLMTRIGGIDNFFTSAVDDEEVTAINMDHNLDADNNNNGIPGDSPPVPTLWNWDLADPAVTWALDYFVESDGSFRFGAVPRDYPGSCRMTGGGNDRNGNLTLGLLATSDGDRYTYGGQIGASTADQPQPSGEWTHHQQQGVGDKFIFRSGTASAPKDTRILRVFCQDPCYCVNARPAPFKQISWDGTGHFANISPTGLEQLSGICNPGPSVNRGQSKKNVNVVNGDLIDVSAGKDGSRHYYRVHVNDLGEPGSGGEEPPVNRGQGKKSTRTECNLDLTKFPDLESPYTITDDQCTDCPDTYQIEIHCTTDPASDVMYSVGAFVEGGNLQIHPPVGSRTKPGECPL